jgi:hypothetical protein
MADLTLTSMEPPSGGFDKTWTCRDGTPYRCNAAEGFCQVRPEHVSDLTNQGWTTATAAQVAADDPGANLSQDVGWAEDPAVITEEQ